jgi:hypothetical protein
MQFIPRHAGRLCFFAAQQQHSYPSTFHFVRCPPCLNVNFPGRWIGRRGLTAWHSRSPYLTPLDIFLWVM